MVLVGARFSDYMQVVKPAEVLYVGATGLTTAPAAENKQVNKPPY